MCRPNLKRPLLDFLKRRKIIARRNNPPRTPPTAAPATTAFRIGVGSLLPPLSPLDGPLVCAGAIGLPIVSDGLDPGIAINDEPDDAAGIANG